jgi:hypothetical protein
VVEESFSAKLAVHHFARRDLLLANRAFHSYLRCPARTMLQR